MNYPDALAWLYGTQLFGIKLGLENIRRLLAALGWHGRDQRFIHVAGTNGKGSVCAMLDAICRADGLRSGLFTSPHLVTFRERIRVDGQMISEKEVASGLSSIRKIVSDWETHPTFFEITTALALAHFQTERADVVALETGMGGRLDATNAVSPAACAITPIALDHQAWLGSTLREIAAEKAGIIKPGVPVVCAPQAEEALAVLRQSAHLRVVSEPLNHCAIALAGSHQRLNAALAVAALEAAGIKLGATSVHAGLRDVSWPGRFQRIGDALVLDGAHNPAAAARLAETWREMFGDERATVILGILRDKDLAGICHRLAPIADSFVATPVRNERSSSTAEICAATANARCERAADLKTALELARGAGTKILATGSLFLVGETLALLGGADAASETSAQ